MLPGRWQSHAPPQAREQGSYHVVNSCRRILPKKQKEIIIIVSSLPTFKSKAQPTRAPAFWCQKDCQRTAFLNLTCPRAAKRDGSHKSRIQTSIWGSHSHNQSSKLILRTMLCRLHEIRGRRGGTLCVKPRTDCQTANIRQPVLPTKPGKPPTAAELRGQPEGTLSWQRPCFSPKENGQSGSSERQNSSRCWRTTRG